MAEVSYKIGNEKLIKVLPGAANRLLGLLKKQGRVEHGGLRIAVVGGGLVYGLLKAAVGIRLSPEQEFYGADLSIHKIRAEPPNVD